MRLAKMADPAVEASWATKPLFYRAPFPPGGDVPRDYQQAAVEYSLSRDNSLIGDAPGLGKSMEAILLSNAMRAERTLVVCPASLRLNWEREIWNWSTIPNVSTYPILSAKDGVSPEANFVIASYDLLRNPNIFNAMMGMRWDHLVLDEAHYLKDPRGNQRTKAICGWHDRGDFQPGIADVSGRLTMLSGTILPNQPSECYNAIRLLCWQAIDGASLETFMDTYYEYGSGFVTGPYQKKDERGELYWTRGRHWSNHVRNVPTNLDDLRHRLRKHLMIRRLKQDVLTELPERQWHPFPLAVTAGMRKALKHPGWAQAERLYELDPDGFSDVVETEGEISTARRLLGEEKAPAVADYAEQLLLEGAEKLVIGAWHHSVLAILRERLAKYGVAFMDGSTTAKRKQAEVDRFQSDPQTRVILGQMLPLGEGWTLTKAQDVILAEPFWVPGKNDQLLDRVHRFGQTGDMVIGHVPVVPNSLDEKILARVIEKDQYIHQALDAE
jgi:SWI/SNF-related matrix-associated actin-dependent regulator of chromatin subfamily A-like protein 1